jgi:protein-disulfide isomerase
MDIPRMRTPLDPDRPAGPGDGSWYSAGLRLTTVVTLLAALWTVPPAAAAKPRAWKPPEAPSKAGVLSGSTGTGPADESCGGTAPRTARLEATGPLAMLDSSQVFIPVMGCPSRGPARASVTLVMFSDFQCPSCRHASHVVDSLASEFTEDLRVVFKQFPLSMHEHAFEASEAALAAHAQGKFWPMHDMLYAHQEEIDRHRIMGWACEIGLDVARFSSALYGGLLRSRVENDIADGDLLNVPGTPVLFLNGHRYEGRRVTAEIAPVIRQLAALGAARRQPTVSTGSSATGTERNRTSH